MDFIERWFGLSPDHGNGTTEALWIVALAAFVVFVAAWAVRHRARRRRRT